MLTRLFLALAGLSWFGFGLYSWISLQGLAEATGVVASTTTAAIELRAIYGGMQIGFGLLVAAGALWPRWQPSSLHALLWLALPTSASRIIAALLAGEFSRYTLMAMAYEVPIALLTLLILLRRRRGQS